MIIRSLYALAPLLFLLIGVELWFRAFPPRDGYRTHVGIVEPDPDLMWRLKPRDDGGLATNQLGFRDHAIESDPDFRILVVGDSVTWGNGIDDVDALFTSRLERTLDADGRGLKFDVVAAAVPGYSTFQELRWLQLHGARLRPDLLVLQFCLNDVVERYRALAEFGGNTMFLGVDTRASVRGLYGVALRRSRAFEAAARAMQAVLRDREQYFVRNLARDELSPELADAWATVDAELDAVADFAEALDVPMMLLVAPYRFQLESPKGLRQPQDRLLEWAQTRSIEVIDVLSYMERIDSRAAAGLFYDESHFSRAGHAFVAELLRLPVTRAIRANYRARFGYAG